MWFLIVYMDFGEDGQVQSILNYLKINAYSLWGYDIFSFNELKKFQKKFFSSMGVKSPPSISLDKINQQKIIYPIIVKPINEWFQQWSIKNKK